MEIIYNQLFTVFGLIGCACYVLSYFLVQMELMDGNEFGYVVMNLVASIFMLLSLTQAFNLGAAVLQIVWIVISIGGIFRKMRKCDFTTHTSN